MTAKLADFKRAILELVCSQLGIALLFVRRSGEVLL